MDEDKEYDVEDEQEDESGGYYDMSDDYDDISDGYDNNDYLSSPSQPNRFINNFRNKKNETDESNLETAKENGAKKNSQTANNKSEKSQKGNKQQGNKTDDTLKKNIGKQAGEKPKESNIAKGGPSGSSGADMAKKMAADKAKNTMNSIHDNNKANESNSEKKSGSDKSEDGEKKDEKGAVASKIEQAKQAGQQAGKEILSKAITAETGIPKPIADKIAEKAMNKQMKKQKIQMYAIIAVLFFFFMIIVGFVFDDDDDQKAETTNTSIKDFYNGSMSDEEFFKSLANMGIVSESACIENDTFNPKCDFMTFIYKIKNGVTGSNQFLYIFYAISYDRNYLDYINNDDELDALLEHKDSLSTYLNGDYLTKYRNDLDSDFDLYGYVKDRASKGSTSSGTSSGMPVCDTIKVNGVKLDTGEIVDGYTLDFEEYVAGVIKHEMFFSTKSEYGDTYYEATKALAVAARTYAYRVTDGCTKPIENSTNYQTFSILDLNNEHDKKVMDLVKEVSGILMKDSNGNLVSGQYDSFCYTSKNNGVYHMHQGNIDIPISWTKKMNIEGMGDTENVTRDGKVHTSGWIRLNCPCNNSQHGNNVDTENKACTIMKNGVIEYLDGGHGNGMSQYGALYLDEEEGLNYDEILKRFYGDDIVLEKPSSELERDPETGFMQRTAPMALSNEYFSENRVDFILGECVWYAYMRANEILDSWGSSKKWAYGNDGGRVCETAPYSKYKRNRGNLIDDSSIDEMQAGDIIGWLSGEYGHIAVIEKVYRDSSGKVTSADITEGGLGFYSRSSYNNGIKDTLVNFDGVTYDMQNYKPSKDCDSAYNSCASRPFVNQVNGWPANRGRRTALCESHGTNCQNRINLTRTNIKIYYYDAKTISKSCIIDLKAYSEG